MYKIGDMLEFYESEDYESEDNEYNGGYDIVLGYITSSDGELIKYCVYDTIRKIICEIEPYYYTKKVV